MAGKGDTPRPCDRVKWDAGWERAFGRRVGRVRFDLRPSRPYGITRDAEITTKSINVYHDAQPTSTPKRKPR